MGPRVARDHGHVRGRFRGSPSARMRSRLAGRHRAGRCRRGVRGVDRRRRTSLLRSAPCPRVVPLRKRGRTMMRSNAAWGLARLIAIGVVSGVMVASDGPSAQSLGARETTHSVQRALERLPYYGVFDFMAFEVDRGAVTLTGYAYHGSLRHAAESATRRTSGVDEVSNRIELLPASQNDDRIRWATFYRIYTDAFL